MKNFKKYVTAMLAIVLCFPITTFAEESVETISASSADKITDIPTEPVQKDQISEHNMSDNPEGTSENPETDTPEKEIVTKDIQIFSNGIEDNAVKDLQNSIENIDKDYSLKNFEIEEAKPVNSNNEYQRFHKNVDIDEFKDSHIEDIKLEKTVNTNIYQVVMPTNTNGIFDFILDPESLINSTNAAAHGGKVFEENSTVFFQRLDGRVQQDYSNKSDFVTITNKSSIPVNVHLEIQINESSISGIAMSNSKDFIDDDRPSLYLALLDDKNIIPIGREGVSIDITIDAAPDGAYEYVYDTENIAYAYKLKDDLSNIKFHEYSFQLTGAANGKGDWSNLTNITPEILVTWTVSPSKSLILDREIINQQQEVS